MTAPMSPDEYSGTERLCLLPLNEDYDGEDDEDDRSGDGDAPEGPDGPMLKRVLPDLQPA